MWKVYDDPSANWQLHNRALNDLIKVMRSWYKVQLYSHECPWYSLRPILKMTGAKRPCILSKPAACSWMGSENMLDLRQRTISDLGPLSEALEFFVAFDHPVGLFILTYHWPAEARQFLMGFGISILSTLCIHSVTPKYMTSTDFHTMAYTLWGIHVGEVAMANIENFHNYHDNHCILLSPNTVKVSSSIGKKLHDIILCYAVIFNDSRFLNKSLIECSLWQTLYLSPSRMQENKTNLQHNIALMLRPSDLAETTFSQCCGE